MSNDRNVEDKQDNSQFRVQSSCSSGMVATRYSGFVRPGLRVADSRLQVTWYASPVVEQGPGTMLAVREAELFLVTETVDGVIDTVTDEEASFVTVTTAGWEEAPNTLWATTSNRNTPPDTHSR
jgi:hypothetical protein